MRILFLGLGNPILSDDGVGIKVVEEIAKKREVEFLTGNINCFQILDIIQGYDRVVIVDAVKKGGEPGTLYPIPLKELEPSIHNTSLHTINLATAIKLGKKLSREMPTEISIYGIEVKDTERFSERFTPEIEKRIPEIVREIIRREME